MNYEYRRAWLLSNIPVTGSYRYKDVFQIIPAEIEAPRPPVTMGHHPLVIEYKIYTENTERKFPDGEAVPKEVVLMDVSMNQLKELRLLLTSFSKHRVFLYGNNQSWFLPLEKKDGGFDKIKWGQEFYHIDNFSLKIDKLSDGDYQKIKLIDPNKYFNQYGVAAGQDYELPGSIEHLYNSYFSLTEEAKKVYLSSCSLLDQGIKLWSEHPSLSFAALVSCLETLITYNHKNSKIEKCNTCGQDRYRVVQKFRDFFLRYGSNTPEFKKYALKIYKHRSKILHHGELFLGEVVLRKFGSFDGFEDDELRRGLSRTCRICMINWLLESGNAA